MVPFILSHSVYHLWLVQKDIIDIKACNPEPCFRPRNQFKSTPKRVMQRLITVWGITKVSRNFTESRVIFILANLIQHVLEKV